MRSNFVIHLLLISLGMSLFAGCQSVRRPGAKKEGIFGLRRAGGIGDLDSDQAIDPMGERSPERLVLDDFAPSNIGTTLKTRTFGSPNPEEAQQLFQEAQTQYAAAIDAKNANPDGNEHKAMFVDAAKKFRIAASRWPESSIEEDSIYYEGESYFFADYYVRANQAYEKLISLYSGTRHLDSAEKNRFAIARYWLELAENYKGVKFNDPQRPRMNLHGEAQRILHRIRLDDPTGKLADDATMALAMAYFEASQYQDSADTFEDLRRNYPGSPFQYQAHMFELKSRLQSYRGPDYDEGPLVKADQLMKTIVSQFPQATEEDRVYLAKEASQIRTQLAARDFDTAKYYENRNENRAAAIYYEQVAQNYSDTSLAKAASTQIVEVKDKPDLPEQKGEWLVNLFPDPNKEKPVLTADLSEKLRR